MNRRKSRWLGVLSWAKKYAKNNPIVAIGFISAGSGGLLLLWYCALIGQLPDFTLGDVTGLFVAAFVTGVLVIGALSFTYVAPAIISRYLLEQILPEKPEYSHVFDKSTNRIEPAAYALKALRAEIFSPTFLLSVASLPILIFSLWLPPGIENFIWPADPGLVRLVMFLQLISAIALVSYGNGLALRLRKTLQIFLSLGFFTICSLYIAHRFGLDPIHPIFSNFSFSSPEDITSKSRRNIEWVRPYVYVFVITLATIATSAFVKASTSVEKKRRIKEANAGPPRHPTPKPSAWHARLLVAISFTFFSLLPLMLALDLAQQNGPAHAVRALGLTIAYLAMFNIMYFQLVNVRQKFWTSWIAAFAVFFVTNNMASQSLAAIPKAPVNVLELGNFHAKSISLSSLQCSALALYGVNCTSNKDEAITLTNVNVLSKIGSTVVLELQVRRDESEADALTPPLPVQHDSHLPGRRLNPIVLHTLTDSSDYKVDERGATLIKARNCDSATASWLKAPWTKEPQRSIDRSKYDRLRCVTITIPKSQFFGYSREGIRNYRHGFTEFVQMQTVSSQR
ncbi:hypothetical protein [Burkholderia cenocepacia]|uniref:hypothetical protein n=1 Tax=Burkholderia cenocepacia TaxID=95486 RepID=UPI0026532F6C|nr:hypothetical protein [Burkholderia cenocepacia]MDN7453978.1 hypothetical protein [Burkholderia cenocepacia]